jgi:hypothetical protein
MTIDDLDQKTQAGFKEVRTEMHDEFKNVRAEMDAGFKDVRAEMHSGFQQAAADLEAGLRDVRTGIRADQERGGDHPPPLRRRRRAVQGVHAAPRRRDRAQHRATRRSRQAHYGDRRRTVDFASSCPLPASSKADNGNSALWHPWHLKLAHTPQPHHNRVPAIRHIRTQLNVTSCRQSSSLSHSSPRTCQRGARRLPIH